MLVKANLLCVRTATDRVKGSPLFTSLVQILQSALPVVRVAQGTQAFRGALRGQIPLGCSQHFVADYEFAYVGRTREGRVIMRVQVVSRVGFHSSLAFGSLSHGGVTFFSQVNYN